MSQVATAVSIIALVVAGLLLTTASLLREVPVQVRSVRATGGEVPLREPRSVRGAQHVRVGYGPGADLVVELLAVVLPRVPALLAAATVLTLVATAARLLGSVA